MGPASLPTMKFDIRASLFHQLAAMEQAGLPTRQAINLTQLPQAEQNRLVQMQRWLGLGLGIADAGLASGLFTAFESSLLRVACAAGSPAITYRRLAQYYAQRASRAKAIKSRMMLPLAMLVIAAFTGPMPQLFSGKLTAPQYLLTSFLPLLAFAAAAYLFVELPRRLEKNSVLLLNLKPETVLGWVPWFSEMSARRNVRDFLESLALLLEAGMPILDALPLAVGAIHHSMLRRDFEEIKTRIEAGASFAQAIQSLSFAGRDQAHAFILAGETSGALSETLFRYTAHQTAEINAFDTQVAEWLPRIAYIGIAAWAAYSIIQSGAFMPPQI